jgi:uncharacterized protein YodC (DUF2158 family)
MILWLGDLTIEMKEYKSKDFEIGETVFLKSNQKIAMTVSWVIDETTFACRWFDNGELKTNSFNPKELIKEKDLKKQ